MGRLADELRADAAKLAKRIAQFDALPSEPEDYGTVLATRYCVGVDPTWYYGIAYKPAGSEWHYIEFNDSYRSGWFDWPDLNAHLAKKGPYQIFYLEAESSALVSTV